MAMGVVRGSVSITPPDLSECLHERNNRRWGSESHHFDVDTNPAISNLRRTMLQSAGHRQGIASADHPNPRNGRRNQEQKDSDGRLFTPKRRVPSSR